MKAIYLFAAMVAVWALTGAPASAAASCDRKCLEGMVEQYLEALARKDPSGLPWAADVRFSENNVMLQIGDGLWGTIGGPATAGFHFADAKAGQAGYFGVVQESGAPAYYALRIRVEAGRISEVETMVHRKSDGTPMGDPTQLRHDPAFERVLDARQRVPRERMIDIANGYFSTLQLNDGKIFTPFHPECSRLENGVATAGNRSPDNKNEHTRRYCEEQFRLGFYIADTRVRDRGFMVVDEERGLVMSRAFIDHDGRLPNITLTTGEVRNNVYKFPHTWCMLELFQIVDGQLYRVEAVLNSVPYHMPSVWRPARATASGAEANLPAH